MQHDRNHWRRTFAVALLATLIALPVLGQGTQSGALQGIARDSSGDALPGVTVTATSPSVQGERTAVTTGNGAYIIRGLPPGQYSIRFSLEGMNTVERSATVAIGVTTDVTVDMSLSTVTETLVVTGEAATALETPTVGANYDYEMVDQLANPRNLVGIALLAPGVTANTPLAGQVAISGGFAYDNAFLLDGVDINDSVFGNPDNLFIEEAIEEVQILTGGISAEFGRFSGGVVNGVTKTGGNDFHGTLRLDVVNPSWRDETPFEEDQGVERDDNRNEIYTATLGGYIVRDRLWFFTAGRKAKTATPALLTGTGIPFTTTNDNERGELKLTASLSGSHRLSGTITDNASDVVRPATTQSSTLDTITMPSFPNDLFIVRYDGVATSKLFLEAQYSEKNLRFENAGGTSTDIFDSPFRCWNLAGCQYNAPLFDANDPEDRNNEQLAGAASWFLSTGDAGSHDLKIGVESFKNILTGGNSNSATDWVFFHDWKLGPDGNPIIDANGKAIPVFASAFETPNFGLGVFFQAFRGSEVSITTDSLYVNDTWQLNDHWSFNLGARYETNSSDTTTGVAPIDTDNIVPRLAATYDIKGDGKYRIDASYAEYVGSYNLALFTQTSNTGNASYVYGPYIGPGGEGIDYAPGFDPDNYFFVAGSIPTLNIFFDEDLSAPTNKEYSLSFGYQLPRGGYVKGTYQNRELTNVVENFITFEGGRSTGELQGVEVTLDNQFFTNTNLSQRDYEALIFQGRYRVLDNLTLQGNWLWQLDNSGNYEGEGGQSIGPGLAGVGDYPEILDERNHPYGTLNDFQEHLVRLWGIYDLDFGRAGNLSLSLLYQYNSPTTYSLAANVGLTAIQASLDPGYAGLPSSSVTFFGPRGGEEFRSFDTVDFAARYNIPLWNRLDLWLKGEIFNLDNERKQIAWNTTIVPDANGPRDNLGRPLGFNEGASFGNPRSNADFVIPREYRVSFGFRF
jgi:hypothetical protein